MAWSFLKIYGIWLWRKMKRSRILFSANSRYFILPSNGMEFPKVL
jgi:hypothetical protein